MNIAKNITDLIGNTPLVELNRLTGRPARPGSRQTGIFQSGQQR